MHGSNRKAALFLGQETAKWVRDGIESVHLRHDPIENTPEYLAVIDEELDTDMYMGKCHAIWHMKRELLEECGIEWRSLGSMNPRIQFD